MLMKVYVRLFELSHATSSHPILQTKTSCYIPVIEVLATIEKVLLDVLDQKSISEAQFLIPDNYGTTIVFRMLKLSVVSPITFSHGVPGKFVISVDDMMSQVKLFCKRIHLYNASITC